MRSVFSMVLLSFIFFGCTYMLEIVSTLSAKEIHHLMSQDTAIYLRLTGLKDVQKTFLNTPPITSLQQGLWYQQFLTSPEYENIQKGVSFANWLFETSSQNVFDNFFGQDVALTLVPKKSEKGFFGLLICQIQDPQKSLFYLDSFYRYILQNQGILREKKTQFAGHPQEVFYFQNTKSPKKETFILVLTDSFLFLANDENLIQYALQRLKENPKESNSLFLQNPSVRDSLNKLPPHHFLTFYADFGQILKTYPQLFRDSTPEVPDKFQQLLEKQVVRSIRDIQTIGFSAQLTPAQCQFSTVVSFQNELQPLYVSSELSPLENYLTNDVFGVLNIRALNQLLAFILEHPKIQQILQKISVLFQGKNILQDIWPRLGEEVSLLLMKQPARLNTPNVPELPALHLVVSGRPPETVLQPIQQSLATFLTAISLDPHNPGVLQYNQYEGIPLFTFSHPDFAVWGEQFLPCYAQLGDRLIFSSSYASLKTLVSHYHQKKTLPNTHPIYLALQPSEANLQKMLAPLSRAGFVLYLPPVMDLLQRNQIYLLGEQQRNNPEIQAQWDFMYRILKTFQNLKFIQTQDKKYLGLTLTLEWK
ncbi:MAG: DUF3352 domain-containing protein [Planctomycetota bacterium]